MRFIKLLGLLFNMRSMRELVFDLKQVESVTKLVKLKVPFWSDKWLDESEVGLKVFIFKSPAKSKLLYSFKALLRVIEILEDGKQIHHFFLAIVISV